MTERAVAEPGQGDILQRAERELFGRVVRWTIAFAAGLIILGLLSVRIPVLGLSLLTLWMGVVVTGIVRQMIALAQLGRLRKQLDGATADGRDESSLKADGVGLN